MKPFGNKVVACVLLAVCLSGCVAYKGNIVLNAGETVSDVKASPTTGDIKPALSVP